MEKHYEKIWDCSSCGRKSISALRNLNCPSCGQYKPDQSSEKFTMVEITDAEGLALVKGGPHWTCSYCSTKNFDKSSTCSGCGTPRGEKGNTKFEVRELGTSMPSVVQPEDSDPYAEFREPEAVEAVEEDYTEYENTRSYGYGSRDSETTNRNRLKSIVQKIDVAKETKSKILIGAAIAIVLSALMFLIFNTSTVDGRVSELSWGRTIEIEEYKRVNEEGWTLPSKAYSVSSESRIKSYNDIYRTETKSVPYTVTKYRDNGNGSTTSYTETEYRTESVRVLERSEPVYATYYKYSIDKWVYARKVEASGLDKKPYWPQFELQESKNTRGLGKERVGSEKEVYTVHFTYTSKNETKTVHKNLNKSDWDLTELGDVYTIKVNIFGAIIGDIEKLG